MLQQWLKKTENVTQPLSSQNAKKLLEENPLKNHIKQSRKEDIEKAGLLVDKNKSFFLYFNITLDP